MGQLRDSGQGTGASPCSVTLLPSKSVSPTVSGSAPCFEGAHAVHGVDTDQVPPTCSAMDVGANQPQPQFLSSGRGRCQPNDNRNKPEIVPLVPQEGPRLACLMQFFRVISLPPSGQGSLAGFPGSPPPIPLCSHATGCAFGCFDSAPLLLTPGHPVRLFFLCLHFFPSTLQRAHACPRRGISRLSLSWASLLNFSLPCPAASSSPPL